MIPASQVGLTRNVYICILSTRSSSSTARPPHIDYLTSYILHLTSYIHIQRHGEWDRSCLPQKLGSHGTFTFIFHPPAHHHRPLSLLVSSSGPQVDLHLPLSPSIAVFFPSPTTTAHMINWNSTEELLRVTGTPRPPTVHCPIHLSVPQLSSRNSFPSSLVSMLGRLSTPCTSKRRYSCAFASFNGLTVRSTDVLSSSSHSALTVLYFLCRYTLFFALLGL